MRVREREVYREGENCPGLLNLIRDEERFGLAAACLALGVGGKRSIMRGMSVCRVPDRPHSIG